MSKRAVLIGINRYKIPGADLRGCVNDVKNMQGVLTSITVSKTGDITALTDFAATKKAMQAAIRDLVSKARAGDVVCCITPVTALTCRTRTAMRPITATRFCADRSRLERPAHRRLAAHNLRQAARGREPDCHHGLLPFRKQHTRIPAAGRADNSALSAQSLGHDGRGVRAQTARQAARELRTSPRRGAGRAISFRLTSRSCSSPAVAIPRLRPTPISATVTTAP